MKASRVRALGGGEFEFTIADHAGNVVARAVKAGDAEHAEYHCTELELDLGAHAAEAKRALIAALASDSTQPAWADSDEARREREWVRSMLA